MYIHTLNVSVRIWHFATSGVHTNLQVREQAPCVNPTYEAMQRRPIVHDCKNIKNNEKITR
jgi:hypothetical protein